MNDDPDDPRAAAAMKRCEICGQVFDTHDLDQVFHHNTAPHEPLPAR